MAIIDLLNTHKAYYDAGLVVGAGSSPQATISVEEKLDQSGQIHKSILTLTDCPLPIVSVTTGNGVGGLKIYDMPTGYIKFLGGDADLSIEVHADNQADYTDNTPEGQLAVGTVAPANADALGTDATDDNLLTAADFTMAAFADAEVLLAAEADLEINGLGTAVDVYLNGLVDAADIDDDTTSEILVSGRIVLIWQNMGDK